MVLKYELKKDLEHRILRETKDEKISYAVPIDVGASGNFDGDRFLVVTRNYVLEVAGDGIVRKIPIADVEQAVAEPGVGGGMLSLKVHGQYIRMANYSAKHRSRYAYVARGINIYRSGRSEEVESHEYEHFCPECHRAIPGTRECPHCSGKGGFWKNFLRMTAPYKKKLAGIMVLMFLAAVVTLLNPEIQKHLVDDALKTNHLQAAFWCLGMMFFLSASIVVINVLKTYYCTVLGAEMAKDLRRQLFAKVQMLSISFINDRRPGELMNRIVRDTDRVREFMQFTFCNMFTVCFIFVCNLIFMLLLNVKLALLSFLLLPAAAFLTVAFRKTMHRLYHRQRKKGDDIASALQDVIAGMRVVKTYGTEAKEKEKFDHQAEMYRQSQRKTEVFWAVFFPAVQFLFDAGVVFVIFFGGKDVLHGQMTTGELLQFITYARLLYTYLNWMTSMPRAFMDLVTSSERMNDILDQQPDIVDGEDAIIHRVKGAMVFDHASFGYKSYQPVLEDLNLEIKKGEMIGIVGASGAGKSTLINLVMRLYEVDDGRILVDNRDIKRIETASYHSQIGVVLQETFLFSGTILNNIKFSKPEATMEEVIRAAKLANAHEFICETPDGYNTYVGEKGFTLSGGERQRIAIARAILSEPRLLILDEATASLDTESEYMIQKALDRLTEGRTTFAIAHRLSTLQNADRLIVIDNHRIAEVGTHRELIEKKGLYYRLVKAQLEMQAG